MAHPLTSQVCRGASTSPRVPWRILPPGGASSSRAIQSYAGDQGLSGQQQPAPASPILGLGWRRVGRNLCANGRRVGQRRKSGSDPRACDCVCVRGIGGQAPEMGRSTSMTWFSLNLGHPLRLCRPLGNVSLSAMAMTEYLTGDNAFLTERPEMQAALSLVLARPQASMGLAAPGR